MGCSRHPLDRLWRLCARSVLIPRRRPHGPSEPRLFSCGCGNTDQHTETLLDEYMVEQPVERFLNPRNREDRPFAQKFLHSKTSIHALMHPCLFSTLLEEESLTQFVNQRAQRSSVLKPFGKASWEAESKRFLQLAQEHCEKSHDNLKAEISAWKAKRSPSQ